MNKCPLSGWRNIPPVLGDRSIQKLTEQKCCWDRFPSNFPRLFECNFPELVVVRISCSSGPVELYRYQTRSAAVNIHSKRVFWVLVHSTRGWVTKWFCNDWFVVSLSQFSGFTLDIDTAGRVCVTRQSSHYSFPAVMAACQHQPRPPYKVQHQALPRGAATQPAKNRGILISDNLQFRTGLRDQSGPPPVCTLAVFSRIEKGHLT